MNTERISQLARIATPLVLLSIAMLSWLPGAERPHTGAPGQIEHAIAYALTAAGMVVGYPKRPLIIALLLAVLAAVLEAGQIWIPGRTSQAIDVLASSVGVLCGLAVCRLLFSGWHNLRQRG